MREKIAVVLTCFNRREKTVSCVESLLKGNEKYDIRFVVVDDGSTDGTKQALEALDCQMKIITGGGKLFWTGGMYTGLEYVLKSADKLDYVMLVNDDVLFLEGAIDGMVTTIKDIGCDAVVGATRDTSGRLSYGGVRKKSKFLARFELMELGSGQQCDTFNCNAVLLKSQSFKDAGNLDRKYVHSMADYDYGMHLRRLGQIVVLHDAYVGICDDNASEGTWKDTSLSRSQRLKLKESPKGLPRADWFHFINKNYGFISAIYHSLTPYIRILLGK